MSEPLTRPSGKLFAVEFMALPSPPFPPMPVRNPQNTSVQNATVERSVAPCGRPMSKKYLIPLYPARRETNPMASRILGPLVSTMRPHSGAVPYTPTVDVL